MATSIAAAAAASTTAQLRFLTDAAHLLRQTAPETSAFLMHRRSDVLVQNLATTSSSSTSTTATNSISASAQAALAFTLSDAQRQHVCTSCGHILIPGSNGTTLSILSGRPKAKARGAKRKRGTQDQTDQTYQKEQKDKTDKKPASNTHTGITKVFACGSCSQETRVALPPPPPLPKNRRPKKAAAAKEEAKPSSVQKTPLSTAPASVQPAAASAETAPKSTNANSKKRAKNRKAGLLALLDKNKGNDNSSGFGGLGLSLDDFRKR